METNNSEFQNALNDLYLAVIKVMKLANPNCLTDDMKRNELIAQLTNWTSFLNGCPSGNINQVTSVVQQPVSPAIQGEITTADSISVQPSVVLVGIRYATAPEEDDNKYYFRRSVELNTPDDSRYFSIKVYEDGSCTYEMKDDVHGEKLQTLIDNKDTMLTSYVVKYSGTPVAGSKIVTIAAGKAVKSGKSIQIVKPLEIRFE